MGRLIMQYEAKPLATSLNVSLDDKYTQESGVVTLTGVQALVRLPMVRRRLDRTAGINSAGFISGYRGSPLGSYDQQLLRAKPLLDLHDIVVRPAVNEDLGATAVWGSQQVGLFPGARVDGVFGIWYGKAPGVDRSGDVFKHANFAGVSPKGGVLAIAGDDHGAKSSSLAAQSEFSFVDAEIPVFAPASIAEVLEFGVKAFDLSRYAGLWTAMTTVADVMDSAGSLSLDGAGFDIRLPTSLDQPFGGLHIRATDTPLDQEERHRLYRLPAALAFVRLNGFDRLPFASPRARFGILAAGKAYATTRQALQNLGVTEALASQIGLRLYKPGLVWPLEPDAALSFAKGLEEILVIEERRDLVEGQLKQIAYPLASDQRPRIVGKRDEVGARLVKEVGELDAAFLARIIVKRLPEAMITPKMREHIARLDSLVAPEPQLHQRKPFYCSGCPHNTSTRVPDGSRATAGIGCHYLVQGMPRATSTFTQMGGEGVTWVGQAPFTDESHIFANLGDGTYFHSGALAIRQAVAAGVDITYKILFNDAVAMTGGQPIDGILTVPILAHQLRAEGVKDIFVVTEDVDRSGSHGALPANVTVRDRRDLDAVQRECRTLRGVSAIIYDQTCATELRRRRKRGLEPEATSRPFINTRVCEGCGDCSTASNCLSIEPVETLYGRKRSINQSSCNMDLSCATGFCPSFVIVEGGRTKDGDAGVRPTPPEITPPRLADEPYNVVLAGIGGQGITSLASILGMAAHLDGGASTSVDMLGMAQKGGGVFVHLRMAQSTAPLHSPRVGSGQTDLLLANDVVVAHGQTVMELVAPGRTQTFLNTHLTPTGDSASAPDLVYDVKGMQTRIAAAAKQLSAFNATELARVRFGDPIYSGLIMTGMAWQARLLPLSLVAIAEAIALNGVAAEINMQAFELGRSLFIDPTLGDLGDDGAAIPQTFEAILDRFCDELTNYQNRAYAQRFRDAVLRVAKAEDRAEPRSVALATAVARSLFKLMAYKDEYEVARLHSDPKLRREIAATFDGPVKLKLSLAPPLFARKDPVTGVPRKSEFGPWIFPLLQVLAKLRPLRGTLFDPFAQTAERKAERALRDQYFGIIAAMELALSTGVEVGMLLPLASAPDKIRGFGHVKARSIDVYKRDIAAIQAGLDSPGNATPESNLPLQEPSPVRTVIARAKKAGAPIA